MARQVQIHKTRGVIRFVRREKIADESLREAIVRAERGIVDADLGGGLIKQRVARQGQGRSGGYRMIVAYRKGNRAVFLFGFAKNDLDNIDANQISELRKVGADLLDATSQRIANAIKDGLLQEVHFDEQNF